MRPPDDKRPLEPNEAIELLGYHALRASDAARGGNAPMAQAHADVALAMDAVLRQMQAPPVGVCARCLRRAEVKDPNEADRGLCIRHYREEYLDEGRTG